MQALMTEAFLTALLFGVVTAGVPLLLAGLGEQISEKAGVLNIGIEGMMLFGAYAGFVAAYYSGSFTLGFIAGGIGGALVAALGLGLISSLASFLLDDTWSRIIIYLLLYAALLIRPEGLLGTKGAA